MTIAELQREFLLSGENRIAPEDFFILLAHATKNEKTFLLAHPEHTLTPEETVATRNFILRRQKHEPIAYITGHKEFYGLDFRVTPDTLIPRPETEHIVELVHDQILNTKYQIPNKITIIDVGTGSGNIIISLAKSLSSRSVLLDSHFTFFASDISSRALSIARENAHSHNADQMITFLEGSLLEPYTKQRLGLDAHLIITANLPYLSESLYEATSPDVHDFEPKGALRSEQAGLSHYLRLLQEVRVLRSEHNSVTLFLEISTEQGAPLTDRILVLLPQAQVVIHKDLAQRDRVVEISLD